MAYIPINAKWYVAELKHIGMDSAEIQKWIPAKDQLAVFRQTERRKSPDYSASEIVIDAARLLADDEP